MKTKRLPEEWYPEIILNYLLFGRIPEETIGETTCTSFWKNSKLNYWRNPLGNSWKKPLGGISGKVLEKNYEAIIICDLKRSLWIFPDDSGTSAIIIGENVSEIFVEAFKKKKNKNKTCMDSNISFCGNFCKTK